MFKLTVVGGPGQGQSFQIKEGENTLGRVNGNDIVVQSQNVSKKHCVLVVDNTGVTVKDAGSSNGTFVNGVMTKLKKVGPGDRISVGDVVLELVKQVPAKPKANTQTMGNNVIALQFPKAPMSVAVPTPAPATDAEPKELKDKIKFYFEKYVINFVYNLNEKYEWRVMVIAMLCILTVGSVFLSVNPVLSRVSEKLTNEAIGRSLLLARDIVDRNSAFIFENTESKTSVAYVEKEPGVIAAYLIDLEGRVLAPGRKLNQFLTEPREASFSAYARKRFADNEAIERVVRVSGETVEVAVPLRVFSDQLKKNVVAATGVVFFDRSQILFDSGTEGLLYIQALILSSILATVIFFSLYKLTLRPIEALNTDTDNVLKGTASAVEKKYKMEEFDPLIDVVNTALQRASSGGGASTMPGMGGGGSNNFDESLSMLKTSYAKNKSSGVLVFDSGKRIQYVSPMMEEVTGIRNDGAVGTEIQSSARDAAFVAFVEDVFAKASSISMGAPMQEDFEFSGTAYEIESYALGSPGSASGYVLLATKKE